MAPSNLYERVLCVVPMVGRCTAEDPRRLYHVPRPPEPKAVAADEGILAFTYQVSEDRRLALGELVARDWGALAAVP